MSKYVIENPEAGDALTAVTAALGLRGTTLPKWSVANGYDPARIRGVLGSTPRSEDSRKLREWVLIETGVQHVIELKQYDV